MKAAEIRAGELYAIEVDGLGIQCGRVGAVVYRRRRVEVEIPAIPRPGRTVLPSEVVAPWATYEATLALAASERSAALAAATSEGEGVRALVSRLVANLREAGASLLAEELTGSAQVRNIAWSGQRVSLAALQQLAQILSP